jgi:hypothetical protein
LHSLPTGRLEDEQHASAYLDLQRQRVAGQRLAANDVAQFEGETLERRQAAGLLVKMVEVEAPTVPLATTVLAHEPIKPAVDPARQVEIGAVDGEDQRVVENGLVKPIRDDELDAGGSALPSWPKWMALSCRFKDRPELARPMSPLGQSCLWFAKVIA